MTVEEVFDNGFAVGGVGNQCYQRPLTKVDGFFIGNFMRNGLERIPVEIGIDCHAPCTVVAGISVLDGACEAMKIGHHGIHPVVEIAVSPQQVAACGLRGAVNVHSLIHLVVHQKAKFPCSFLFKLPEPNRLGRRHHIGAKGALLDAEVFQVVGHAHRFEGFLHKGQESVCPFHHFVEIAGTLGNVIHIALHFLLSLSRKVHFHVAEDNGAGHISCLNKNRQEPNKREEEKLRGLHTRTFSIERSRDRQGPVMACPAEETG